MQIITTFGTRGFFFGDSNQITYGGRSVEKVIVRGAEPQYTEAIPLFAVQRGRFISAFDQEHARPVVVLGAAISESLFPIRRRGRQNRPHQWPALRSHRGL